MHEEMFTERLLRLPLDKLERFRCDQFETKEQLVQDIIDNDDGSVQEVIEAEDSFIDLMTRGVREKRLDKQGVEGKT